MPPGLSLASTLLITVILFPLLKVVKVLYNHSTSPVKNLPGPKGSSWIYGNLKDIWDNDSAVLHEQWVADYGSTLKYKGLFGMNWLFTVDTKAISHILMNSHIYQKPEEARYAMTQLLGNGVIVAEGEKHRQQRRIMNPAFGNSQIRELTEIFIDKAVELRDAWATEVVKAGGVARIDALSWFGRATLDVIGLAGFNYYFDAISRDPETNELNNAFGILFKAGTRISLVPFLRATFPLFRLLPAARDAETKQARKTMNRIGQQLLSDSKAILSESNEGLDIDKASKRRDLLTLLLRANMATDLLPSQRMSDEDVLAQVPTFLVAGHETTSVGTTWALFSLTQYPHIQEKLRTELLTISTDNPTMDDLNSLPYFDAVVRETMRLHPPVPSRLRVATQDDVIPLEKPVKGRGGNLLRVTKGQTIFIPIVAINRSQEIWGEDAAEFKPERWYSVPNAASSIPGVWGNVLTFLGGPRACIGFRFSLIEMKALLFTLLRAFEFELAVPASDIKKKFSIVQRPVLISDPNGENQMPLLVKPYQRL